MLVVIMSLSISTSIFAASFSEDTSWGEWAGTLTIEDNSGVKTVEAKTTLENPTSETRLYLQVDVRDNATGDIIKPQLSRTGDYGVASVELSGKYEPTDGSKISVYSANEIIYTTGKVEYLLDIG